MQEPVATLAGSNHAGARAPLPESNKTRTPTPSPLHLTSNTLDYLERLMTTNFVIQIANHMIPQCSSPRNMTGQAQALYKPGA